MGNHVLSVVKSCIGGIIVIGAIVLPASPALAHPGHGAVMQILATQNLTPSLTLIGLGTAFLVGSSHALAPGHGKTMVAAYLIGKRGTFYQALLLGLITTITHTLGVFALGLFALVASRYVLPEQLYPILSFASGITVCGVGFWLLDSHLHSFHHPHEHVYSHEHTHPHEHTHHPHPHIHEEHPISAGAVTQRSLLALGIAGGLVPCPSALILLLSAIALHQAVYGLLLVSAFSMGLASVLSLIGISVIYAQRWFNQPLSWMHDRFPISQVVMKRMPLISAIAVILVGAALSACAVA
jgi:nickel/cobalt exporter